MIRGNTLAWLAAACAVSLGGCAAYKQKGEELLLERQVRAYTKAIRWSDFEGAATYLRRPDGSVPPVDTSVLEGIRVVDVVYAVSAESRDQREARMLVTFQYQLPASASLRRISQDAVWWYDEEAGRWFLDDDDLPDFLARR